MYWSRDPRNNHVRVYFYKDGRARLLPRKLYAHLDAHPDTNINTWVESYAETHVNRKITPEHLVEGALGRYVDEFLAWEQGVKHANSKTWKQHDSLLRRYAIPYFLGQETPLRDPNQWSSVSTGLLSWLQKKEEVRKGGIKKKVSPETIRRTNIALRRFYKWLQDTQVVHNSSPLSLWNPPPPKDKKTPNKLFISPEKIFELLPQYAPEWQLYILLGYFFSLRPQELFNIRRKDFRAGKAVEELECAKAMAKNKLWGAPRLAVKIETQRGVDGESRAKTSGWVCCFSEAAAKLIVPLFNDMPYDRPIFDRNMRTLYKDWAAAGRGFTLKDLRRASLYHLGHHTAFQNDLIGLMKHARHLRNETTLIYLRRPDETIDSLPMPLDLGA